VQELPLGQGLLPPGELHTGKGPTSMSDAVLHETYARLPTPNTNSAPQVVPSGQSLCVSQWNLLPGAIAAQNPVPTL
jgi:hypothetical protein